MTQFIHEVSLNTIDELVNLAATEGYTVETYEGVLNDTHIIYADSQITLGSRRGYDYIVCSYRFASPNHNTLHIMLTDDFDEVLPYIPVDYDEA